jgi:hypothetical protein
MAVVCRGDCAALGATPRARSKGGAQKRLPSRHLSNLNGIPPFNPPLRVCQQGGLAYPRIGPRNDRGLRESLGQLMAVAAGEYLASAVNDRHAPASRFRQFHERPLKSLGVTAAQPIVPPPMHALRLLRKRFCYALTASQAHLDFSRRFYPSFAHRFLLARIGRAQALPARKDIAGVVDRCDPPSTIPSVGIDLTSEPGASATEVAFGPCDWNALPNIFPFGRAVRARTVDEHDSVMLG